MTVKKTVAKKIVKKKASAKKVAVKKVPAKKKAVAKKKVPAKKRAKKALSAEQRYKMVEDAAYYLAEKAGFTGNTLDHWIKAEKQIEAKLRTK